MRLISISSFQGGYVQQSRNNNWFRHEKVFQIISIVLPTEQSIKAFAIIFQGFLLNFKSTFKIFKKFMNVFCNDFRRTSHDECFYQYVYIIAIYHKNKRNLKVVACNINIRIHQGGHCTVENLRGLDMKLVLNNVQTTLVKITDLVKLHGQFRSGALRHQKRPRRARTCKETKNHQVYRFSVEQVKQ